MSVSRQRPMMCLPLATPLAALLFATLDLRAADWPQWRGLKRDGISYETGCITNWPPTEVWRRTDLGNANSYSSVALSENRLYTLGYTTRGSGSNLVYCLDASVGTQIWVKAYSCGNGDSTYIGPRSTPVVYGSELYTLSQDGHFHCFDKYTGAIAWSKTINIGRPTWGFAGSPLIEGDMAILNVGGGGVAIERKPPHNLVWSNTTGTAGYSSPLIYTATNNQRVVVIFSNTSLKGLNATNGQSVWSFSWSTSYDVNAGDPVLYRDKIFISTGYGKGGALVQLGAATPTSIWNNANLVCKTSSAVVQGDYVYGIDEGGSLRCLDIRTGAIKWQQSGFTEEGGLMLADEKLVVLTRDGNLRLVKATHTNYVSLGAAVNIGGSGDCRTAPVLSNGRIYCRRQNLMVCYRVGPAPETDGDTDGIADVWEQKHFAGAANCGPTDDTDGDGISNRDEYLAGTDPTNTQSCLSMSATSAGGNLVLNTPTIKAQGTGYMARARFYTMESSTGLTGAAWSPFPDCMNIVGTNAPISYTNSPAGFRKFYRMKVTLE